MPLFMDKALARRLERTEGAINASFVDARARLSPDSGVAWREIAGTYAMFDGIDSPMTQTFGLGLFEPVMAGDVAAMEAFYQSRGADVFHEVCPLAGVEAFALLVERGYRPTELSTVLARSVDGAAAPEATPGLVVRRARPEEAEAWIETSIAGWAQAPDQADHVRNIARLAFANTACASFLVERDGRPIATGSLGVHEGVALFAGASTLPGERGHGAQKALLAARLAEASRRGCDVAMMAAEPGSTSQRNAERNGFQVAYTRVKWKLALRDAD